MAKWIKLYETKKPVNHEVIRTKVGYINRDRFRSKQPIYDKTKIRCPRYGDTCTIYGRVKQ